MLAWWWTLLCMLCRPCGGHCYVCCVGLVVDIVMYDV